MKPTTEPRDTVVLVHGLGRTPLSMQWLGRQLEAAGYSVLNVGYASTRLTIRQAADCLRATLDARGEISAEARVHFVTHSLGGIVVRELLANPRRRPANLGRVVMLAPPNQGSEVADRLMGSPIYRWATGPAGQELGTSAASSPNLLGPVDYDVGIIAGRASLNPLFSAWIGSPNDGKVSVTRTAVAGQRDLMVVRRSHTFLMRSSEVARQTVHFLAHGKFQHLPASA